MIIKFFLRKKLIAEKFAQNLLSWRHSGFSIDNQVKIPALWRKALSQYIAKPPVSLKKVLFEQHDGKVIYMPALRKTRRIISSEKAKNFMGSEFSYSDITPPTIADFHYKKLGERRVAGTLCWELEILPINEDIADENGFSKKISFIGREDFVIRKAVYYDLDGELLKELERSLNLILTGRGDRIYSIFRKEFLCLLLRKYLSWFWY